MSGPQSRSPYQGLIPYEEDDAPFFFGREKDTRLIIANLFASPLTLLYGASGVGKSSVLHAGVMHDLRPREDLLLVVISAWQIEPLNALKAGVVEAVTRIGREKIVSPVESASLAQYLQEYATELDRRLMIILDQFEEYFLYNPHDDAFAVDFPHAVNQADLPVSFLISMREDSLAKLDRFEGRIPNLFDNYLRIDHLDRKAAKAAIEEPIAQYNRLRASEETQVSIEPALVDAVVEQIRTGRVVIGDLGRGAVEPNRRLTSDEVQIETPYLQLVMTRLWKEEMDNGSLVLRFETLKRLGGAETIVRTHLDDVMDTLSLREQDAAARVFHYLVTPGGTKIAHSVPDLAGYADLTQAEVAPVLNKLSKDFRILRPVAPPPGQSSAPRYEIFHDVIGPAILDWRTRYVQAQETTQQIKRQRVRFFQVMAGVLVLFTALFYWTYSTWLKTRPWGSMRNLSKGTAHALNLELVSMGRSKNLPNTINLIFLPENTVSRIHLQISKNLLAFDWRSLNGTTINAEFLPYGTPRKLKTGDIVVLAGIAPFQFETVEYSGIPFWTPSIRDSSPPSGWGMLIDGKSRTVTYMDKNQYFLSLDANQRVILQDSESANSLLRIQRYKDGRVTILDFKDGTELLATMKEGDNDYPEYGIPSGIEFDGFRTDRESHDIFEVAYRYGQVRFQIVPTESTLERLKSSQ